MKLRNRLLAGAALAGALALAPTLALAQGHGPYYVTPKLLYSYEQSSDYNASTYTPSDPGIFNVRYGGGSQSKGAFGGGVAAGYDFGAMNQIPVRMELEFMARQGQDFQHSPKVAGVFNHPMLPPEVVVASYNVNPTVYSVFANVYYDFVNDSKFTPYVGAGLGGAYMDVSMSSRYVTGGGQVLETEMGGSHANWSFAWNVGAGCSYTINDNMALDLGYRYASFGKAESGPRNVWMVSGVNPMDPNEVALIHSQGSTDLSAHEFMLGLRIWGD